MVRPCMDDLPPELELDADTERRVVARQLLSELAAIRALLSALLAAQLNHPEAQDLAAEALKLSLSTGELTDHLRRALSTP